MPVGHGPSIYLYVHILISSRYLDLCILGSCCGIVDYLLDNLLDIAALSELEAQAFRYTHNNIC